MPQTALIEAVDSLNAAFRERTRQRRTRLRGASQLHDAGRFAEAEHAYQDVLTDDPRCAAAWTGLSRTLQSAGRGSESLEAVIRSLEIDPLCGRAHHTVGLLLRDDRVAMEARLRYERIMRSTLGRNGSGGDDSAASLAEVLERLLSVCRRAIEERHEGALLHLGNIHMARQDPGAAIGSYRDAVRDAPFSAAAARNLSAAYEALHDRGRSAQWLGFSLVEEGEHEEAIEALRYVVDQGSAGVHVYGKLAESYRMLRRWDDAIRAYEEGIAQWPDAAGLYFGAVAALQKIGRTADAIRVVRRGMDRCPGALGLKFMYCLMLPPVYESHHVLSRFRQRYAAGLARLVRETRLESPDDRRAALDGLGRVTNYYLPYQGGNDKPLQLQYGRWVARIMAANYPEWTRPRAAESAARGKRVRVGYTSADFRLHSVAKSRLGWLRHADRDAFEIYCYSLDKYADVVTDEFRRCSDVFHCVADLEAACRRIAADRLDILVHLGIPTAPLCTQLAALRLAPVQCTTWVPPETSGLPTIDYFISADLMEPSGAEEWYSEQLVRLPRIGVSYEKPAPPAASKARSDFGIRDDALVYLCCQSPYKYLPQYDQVLVDIARRVPDAQFVFLEGHPSARRLEQRLRRAFTRAGLSAATLLFVPQQSYPDFLRLLAVADVFLDTFEWSGANTTLEAIAMGLPIVTCPRGGMRGRHSSAILMVLDVTDTIAGGEREFVDTAVRLAVEAGWRREISARMIARQANLYDDTECVKALERFYRRVAYRDNPGVGVLDGHGASSEKT